MQATVAASGVATAHCPPFGQERGRRPQRRHGETCPRAEASRLVLVQDLLSGTVRKTDGGTAPARTGQATSPRESETRLDVPEADRVVRRTQAVIAEYESGFVSPG